MNTPNPLRRSARQPSRAALQWGFGSTSLMGLAASLGAGAILLSLAAPTMAAMIDSVRLSASTQLFVSSLRVARGESLKRGGRVAVCKSADGINCELAGGWEQGWIVFRDTNGNGGRDEGELLVERVEPLAAGVRLTGSNSASRYIAYWSGSIAKTAQGAPQAGTLTVCPTAGVAADARQIVIASDGLPKVRLAAAAACA
jgi:type IV fimbrial biogenesis protein FimT